MPHAHLVLMLAAEPRPYYEALRRLAASLGNDDRIHFVASAPRSELAELLRDANCIVVPSLTEGFGLTTAEACALDIPVVATRTGSIPEVISGRHLLVEPDSPEQLADAIARISRGQWDVTPRKIFRWETMVDAYEALYRDVLAGPSRGT